MITLTFYKDGFEANNHERIEVCAVVSYALWSCMSDIIKLDVGSYAFTSNALKETKDLGLSYLKITKGKDRIKAINLMNRMKDNIKQWNKEDWDNIVKIIEIKEEYYLPYNYQFD